MKPFTEKMQQALAAVPGFVGADAPMSEESLGHVVIEPASVDAALSYLSRRFHVGELDVSAGVGLVIEVVPRSRKTPSKREAMAKCKPVQYEFTFGSDSITK